ncbi:metallophosphoesterase [Peptacetobacter hominis]|uniref:Metallophosphoesterase n=1 Tax=Peptacetobacter hominis TaxID=2743610 RepID=A0A544QUW6_9FIRM|nr:metallophosphoesterase [Peptacetobacter hominis]TQQ84493.1 metallophosphoesterase [Peptacetobacter hominis]
MINRKKKVCIISALIAIFSIYLVWGTNSISISRYNIENSSIPESFKGFRIVQVSDLHNKEFGKDQRILMKKIEKEKPDIIVVTGDLVDRRKWGTKNAMSFIDRAMEIAPVYYVSGNHEVWSGKYSIVRNKLLEKGVYVLDDDTVEIKNKNSHIFISGIIDTGYEDRENYVDDILRKVSKDIDDNTFSILLSHRPEHIKDYSEVGFDLVFSGHAHGGQIRFPFIGGVYAPHQGFMPKYTSGMYQMKNTFMVVSRGLGNSVIPIRFMNRPEITVTELM